MKTRYFVVAAKWSDEKETTVNYIAGEFAEFALARIFKDAYNEHFNANAIVIDESTLMNL